MVAIELKQLQEQQAKLEALEREKIHAVRRFEELTTKLCVVELALKDARSRAA